jgi:hypothetical protein
MIFEVMIAESTWGTVESKLQVRNMSGPIYRKDAACFEGRSNLAGVGMREPSGCLHVR